MNCHSLCQNYKAKWNIPLGKDTCYCSICKMKMDWKKNRCPCCNMRVRRRPKNKKYYTTQQEKRLVVRQ